MVKKYGKVLSCNYSCTLYLLMKIKEIKLKNLHTSASLNLPYGTTKQKLKCKGCKNCEIYQNL